jgi:hypothetical protein
LRNRLLACLGLAAVVVTAALLSGRGTAEGEKRPGPRPAAKAADGRRPAGAYAGVLVNGVPHIRQKPDFCGEACAAMYLQKLGRPADQDYVFDCSGLDPILARGCYTRDLAAALENIGFRIGPVWHKIPAGEPAEPPWRALHADLLKGTPSIVCMRYDARPGASEHFRLVLGYDADSDEVIYHDPAEAGGAHRRMARTDFLALWPLKYDQKEWTVIRLRLEPGRLKPAKASQTYTAADYAQHLMQLKPKVPKSGFTVVIQPPFVVLGDESPEMVRRRAEGTVKWAVDKLKDAYFAKDPAKIIDIWLFKDKASYRKHCRSIFNRTPTTPYGFFSHTDNALVMNIATGGGTLVHEIVHPFVAADFPECPAWFNEGLGSLYEQSAERNGQIIGRTNWRLIGGWPPNADGGLQRAIKEKRVPSFQTLCTTTDNQFYRDDTGTNYAHARYLCYYLQEHGLLRKFYHAFRANCRKDPSGYHTLQQVLGRKDMDQFRKEWEAYVLKLRFP